LPNQILQTKKAQSYNRTVGITQTSPMLLPISQRRGYVSNSVCLLAGLCKNINFHKMQWKGGTSAEEET